MSHFNHPCITTPACISPSHSEFCSASFVRPAPCVTYIPIRTSGKAVHLFPRLFLPLSFSSLSALGCPFHHYTSDLLLPPSPLSPHLAFIDCFPPWDRSQKRDLPNAPIMLSKITPVFFPPPRHPIYPCRRTKLFWFSSIHSSPGREKC